jgi:hypothetical protein
VLPDGRTIEEAYQLDCKGWRSESNDWRYGKGKPPKDTSVDLWAEYKQLWNTWADANPELLQELATTAKEYHDCTLSDMFASTDISQARALAEILNERAVV